MNRGDDNLRESQGNPTVNRRKGVILISVLFGAIAIGAFVGISVVWNTPIWLSIPFILLCVISVAIGAKLGYKRGKKMWE